MVFKVIKFTSKAVYHHLYQNGYITVVYMVQTIFKKRSVFEAEVQNSHLGLSLVVSKIKGELSLFTEK